jgi:hypothetical protein
MEIFEVLSLLKLYNALLSVIYLPVKEKKGQLIKLPFKKACLQNDIYASFSTLSSFFCIMVI